MKTRPYYREPQTAACFRSHSSLARVALGIVPILYCAALAQGSEDSPQTPIVTEISFRLDPNAIVQAGKGAGHDPPPLTCLARTDRKRGTSCEAIVGFSAGYQSNVASVHSSGSAIDNPDDAYLEGGFRVGIRDTTFLRSSQLEGRAGVFGLNRSYFDLAEYDETSLGLSLSVRWSSYPFANDVWRIDDPEFTAGFTVQPYTDWIGGDTYQTHVPITVGFSSLTNRGDGSRLREYTVYYELDRTFDHDPFVPSKSDEDDVFDRSGARHTFGIAYASEARWHGDPLAGGAEDGSRLPNQWGNEQLALWLEGSVNKTEGSEFDSYGVSAGNRYRYPLSEDLLVSIAARVSIDAFDNASFFDPANDQRYAAGPRLEMHVQYKFDETTTLSAMIGSEQRWSSVETYEFNDSFAAIAIQFGTVQSALDTFDFLKGWDRAVYATYRIPKIRRPTLIEPLDDDGI